MYLIILLAHVVVVDTFAVGILVVVVDTFVALVDTLEGA